MVQEGGGKRVERRTGVEGVNVPTPVPALCPATPNESIHISPLVLSTLTLPCRRLAFILLPYCLHRARILPSCHLPQVEGKAAENYGVGFGYHDDDTFHTYFRESDRVPEEAEDDNEEEGVGSCSVL